MPPDSFALYIDPTIGKEGGYSDNPNDSGGPTMWGIIQVRARAAGYMGDMRDLDRDRAVEIYRLFYWQQPQFDRLTGISQEIAMLCLDFGVNMGTPWPGKFVQRALNVLNRGGQDWPDLNRDGNLGAMSRAALQSYKDRRGSVGMEVLVDMIRAQASVRYIEIAEGAPKNEDFEFGWQSQRAFSLAK